MRIGTIYTIYSGRTGVEFAFERILREILKIEKDVEFTVFCNQKAFSALKKEDRLNPVLINALDNRYAKAFWLESVSKNYINKNSLDLFWIPSGTNHFPGRWDIPAVTTIHDIGEYHIRKKYGFVRNFYRKAVSIPRSLKRSSSIVAVSHFTASDIANTLGYKKRIRVIYQASGPWENAAEEIPAGPVRQDQVINFNRIILCVGRIFFIGKGIDIILNGYRDIFKQNPCNLPPLIFVGPSGEQASLLEKFIKRSGLQDNIYYLGQVSNNRLESLYKAACVTVFASRYEGFGMAVLESMKRKVPCLCADLGAIREISGNAPVFFKSEDSSDFAHKLTEILNGSIDLRANTELGSNIASRYSWQKTAKEYLDVFRLSV